MVQAIVDFLYFGEMNNDQSNLDKFLEIGKELKLKGLTDFAGQNKHKIILEPRDKKDINILNKDQNMLAVGSIILDGQVESNVYYNLASDGTN